MSCQRAFTFFFLRLYNLTNIGLNIHSDMLCDISRKKEVD